MLQAKMSEGDKRLYNPSRDVAHNFQEVMNIVAGRLEDGAWRELTKVLEREGVSMDDLGDACGNYCIYVSSAADPDKGDLSMIELLRMSGFLDCKPAAQVAVLAMIGTCYAGIQFGGIREATVNGEGPLETIGQVAKHAERLQLYMRMPRWRRRLAEYRQRVARAVRAMKSNDGK